MRIGIYGGTFDPVHLAHLVLAEQCREQLSLDEIWFMPAAHPPHKAIAGISPAKDRLQMLEFAIAGHAQFRISELELNRPGPSYTVDTLQQLVAERPEVEWSLLIGADSLRDFRTWREPERIARLAEIAVVNRGGETAPDLATFRQEFGNRIRQVEIPDLQISATDLRQRVRSGRSIRYLVPRAVEVYIRQSGLYATSG